MLTDEQKKALDDMVERRMQNTGETREVAAKEVAKAIRRISQNLENGAVYDVVDNEGRITGYRDVEGYHPYN